MSKLEHHHCDGCRKDLGSGNTKFYEVHFPGQLTMELDQTCLDVATHIFRYSGYTRGIDKSVRGKPSQVYFSKPVL